MCQQAIHCGLLFVMLSSFVTLKKILFCTNLCIFVKIINAFLFDGINQNGGPLVKILHKEM